MQVLPSLQLRPYIACFRISENQAEEKYKVMPKPFVVMGIQYKGNIAIVNKDKEQRLTGSGITGLSDTCRTFKATAGTGTILIEFLPCGVAKFFNFPVNSLYSSSLSLAELTHYRMACELEERISSAKDSRQRINILEHFFLSRLETGRMDALVHEAVMRIQLFNGNIRMRELADSLCISQRQFEKRFLSIVGSSPKKFSSLVRFNFILSRKGNFKNLTELSLEAGYFDQAHFTKDFKIHAGLTPEQFFGNSVAQPMLR